MGLHLLQTLIFLYVEAALHRLINFSFTIDMLIIEIQ